MMKAVLAMTLDAAGKAEESLTAWREVLAELGTGSRSTLAARAQAQIKRLSKPGQRG